MRVFLTLTFTFLAVVVSTSTAHAAVCPAGTPQNIEDGKYYYQSVECTPQTTGTTGISGGSSGGTTGVSGGSSGNTYPGNSIALINPLAGADCSAGNRNCLESFLLNLLEFVIRIGAIVIVLMLVVVGYRFVAAQGKPEDIKAARQMLLWTLVGALVLLGSQAIAMAVKATVQALAS